MSYGRSEFHDLLRSVRSSSRLLCAGFQRDLSALLDGELAERAASRTLAHLESCGSCSEFFQAIRLQALAHRDLAVPGSLARRLRRMRGEDLFEGMADAEIIRRLTSALYQLGKAYVLLATERDYLLKVAEEPVEVDCFEQGELAEAAAVARKAGVCHVPMEVLEAKDSHLRKGRQLLEEALRLKPRFAEARLYLGFVCQVQEDLLAAEREYREVFLRTDRLVNRGHAAIQLGMLYNHAGRHGAALRLYRWVVASGLVARRPEFAFVLYNIVVEHMMMGDAAAAARMLRRLRTAFPEVWKCAQEWARRSPEFFARLQGDAECRLELEAAEPAFLAARRNG